MLLLSKVRKVLATFHIPLELMSQEHSHPPSQRNLQSHRSPLLDSHPTTVPGTEEKRVPWVCPARRDPCQLCWSYLPLHSPLGGRQSPLFLCPYLRQTICKALNHHRKENTERASPTSPVLPDLMGVSHCGPLSTLSGDEKQRLNLTRDTRNSTRGNPAVLTCPCRTRARTACCAGGI